MTEQHAEYARVLADLREKHGGRVQNIDGDWLCSCGAFLAPSGDDRLESAQRQHIDTVIDRVAPCPCDPNECRAVLAGGPNDCPKQGHNPSGSSDGGDPR